MALSDCGQNNIDSLVNLTLATFMLHHQNIALVFEINWSQYDFLKGVFCVYQGFMSSEIL